MEVFVLILFFVCTNIMQSRRVDRVIDSSIGVFGITQLHREPIQLLTRKIAPHTHIILRIARRSNDDSATFETFANTNNNQTDAIRLFGREYKSPPSIQLFMYTDDPRTNACE
jgi:hypothetical protein